MGEINLLKNLAKIQKQANKSSLTMNQMTIKSNLIKNQIIM